MWKIAIMMMARMRTGIAARQQQMSAERFQSGMGRKPVSRRIARNLIDALDLPAIDGQLDVPLQYRQHDGYPFAVVQIA